MNDIMFSNYNGMSDIEIVANGQNGIYVVLSRIMNENQKRDARLGILEKSSAEITRKITSIEEKMDYIASPENSIMYKELVSICCKRVDDILDSTNDGLYKNFWKPFLNKNIHNYLSTQFQVGSDRYIKTKHFENAKYLARNYIPTDSYIKEKVDTKLSDMRKGVIDLSKDRLLSFKLYLNDSNNGTTNLFNQAFQK